MKAFKVYENMDFKRGQEPKDALNLGMSLMEIGNSMAIEKGFRQPKSPKDLPIIFAHADTPKEAISLFERYFKKYSSDKYLGDEILEPMVDPKMDDAAKEVIERGWVSLSHSLYPYIMNPKVINKPMIKWIWDLIKKEFESTKNEDSQINDYIRSYSNNSMMLNFLNFASENNMKSIVKDIAKYIIKGKISTLSSSDKFNLALKSAIKNNKVGIASYLLDLGANVNNINDVLIPTIKKRRTKMLELLMDAGIDITMANNFAYRWAKKKGYHDILDMIKKYKNKEDYSLNESYIGRSLSEAFRQWESIGALSYKYGHES